MKRLLLSIPGQSCPFGCTYCFSSFSQYKGVRTIDQVERNPAILRDIDVIYPACDSDFFAATDAAHLLRRIVAFGRSVSISTKAHLRASVAAAAGECAAELKGQGHVLKIGVSFATKRRIRELEPGATGYRARVENLRMLDEHEVATSVVLKPILNSVPLGEYKEIIQDTQRYTRAFLLGGEYLDVVSVASASASIRMRKVRWLEGAPCWPYEDSAHIAALQQYLLMGLRGFEWVIS